MSACRPHAPRLGVIAALSVLALTACGGGQRQDVAEPSHSYAVAITSASFPAQQKLSEHTHLVLTIKNVSSQPIPNLAVTVCNVTCTYPAPPGQGSSSSAFANNLGESSLANPSRPVWVVDRPPGSCTGRSGFSCTSGGAGGFASAYTNTWAAGRVAPGQTVRFVWGVTAVKAGHFVVGWKVAAGLNGKARAYLSGSGSGAPQGQFAVTITAKPAQSYVNNSGQIVTTGG